MKRQTKKLNSKKIIQVVTMLILCLILVFACIFGYSVYKDTATFDSKKLLSSGASVMYDSNGDIMYTYGSQENGTRKNVTYDDLPQVLVDAIVAAEDSRFFRLRAFSARDFRMGPPQRIQGMAPGVCLFFAHSFSKSAFG